MNRSPMKDVMNVIRRHRRFVVSAHLNPEGDALGSALSLGSLLKRLGKQVVLGNDGGIPEAYNYLPRLVPVLPVSAKKVSAQVSMIVDVPLLDRVGSMKPLIQKVPLVVNIDHHISNQRFGNVNWVDPKAAAVGEMIYRLYDAFRITPTREEAVCLYVSLVTDTGSFRYCNTTPVVHQMASKLLGLGVDPLEISQHLYESHSSADLKFLGTVLRNVKQTPDRRVAWLEVPLRLVKSFKAGPEILDELVNYPRSIQTAEVSFLLREAQEKGLIRASFRSKGRIDVNKIARHFGGGGHMAASGCSIHGTTLAGARAQILKVVRKALKQ